MNNTEEAAARYRWVIIGVLWSTYIVIFMHRLGVGPLAPFLKDDLGLTNAQVGSLMSAAALGYLVSIMPAGWAVDRIGVRRMLLIGEVVGGIFMLGMFLAQSYQVALVLMALSGFGCGCLMPSTTKGVMVWFPLRERATVMGLKQTGVNVGGIIAGAALPPVAIALGWRFGFLFLGILAVVIGIVSYILYKESPKAEPGASNGADAPDSISGQAGHRSVRQLLRNRDMWLVTIAGFALAVVEFAIMAHLVLYLTEILLVPAVTAGMMLAMANAGGALGKPGGGLLSDRVFRGSRRKVFMLWAGISCVMCALITVWGDSLSWALYPVLIILGITAIGWGGVQLTLVAELAGRELAGTATGTVGVFVNAGCMVGPILFGHLVDISGSYQPAWLSCTIFSAICVAALFFMREGRRI